MSRPYKKAIDKLDIPTTYFEGGIIPARGHQFLDRKGVLGASSFCDDISWVDDFHMLTLSQWKSWYIKRLKLTDEETVWKGGDYIFCPMQCAWDANFNPDNRWSPYLGGDAMDKFILDMQSKYPNERIIFRCHPADLKNFERYKNLIGKGNELKDSNWTTDISKYEPELVRLMLRSKQVIGVNTTCLLQSVLMGVPTTALGWGYVKSVGENPEQQLRMVAAVRHRSFRWNNIKQAQKVMEEIHELGTVCWN